MALYVIERSFADQLDLTDDDVELIEEINSDEGVRWLFSFLSADRRRTYCLYEAPSPDAILAAARKANVPADAVVEVERRHAAVLGPPARLGRRRRLSRALHFFRPGGARRRSRARAPSSSPGTVLSSLMHRLAPVEADRRDLVVEVGALGEAPAEARVGRPRGPGERPHRRGERAGEAGLDRESLVTVERVAIGRADRLVDGAVDPRPRA